MAGSRDAARVVEVDLDGGWVARMEWPEGATSGGPGVLVIEPSDPDSYPHGGISSTLLRGLDFREAAETLRRQLAAQQSWHVAEQQYDEGRDDRIKAALAEGITDQYLSLLSSRYVQITNRGQSHPLRVLAEITGKTESTVKGHLWQARKRGLLEGSPGRAGGQLTPKAQGIVRKALSGT